MGKRKAFGESPEEMLLKRRLGTAEYNKRKEELTPKKPKKIPKRPEAKIVELPNPWGRGILTWQQGVGGMWTVETTPEGINPFINPFYAKYKGFYEEDPPEETTEDWADKWAAENEV